MLYGSKWNIWKPLQIENGIIVTHYNKGYYFIQKKTNQKNLPYVHIHNQPMAHHAIIWVFLLI